MVRICHVKVRLMSWQVRSTSCQCQVRTGLDNVRSRSRTGHGQLMVRSRSCQIKVKTGQVTLRSVRLRSDQDQVRSFQSQGNVRSRSRSG